MLVTSENWARMRLLFLSVGACFALPAGGHAAPSECRTAALPDGTPALFCKDKKGNWKQQAGKVEAAPATVASSSSGGQLLYADATYRGTAIYDVPIKTRQRRPRTLFDLAVESVQPKTQKQEIFASTTMRINGDIISGTITGGGWTNNVPITGTRKDGVCNITGALNGETVVYVGKCGASDFTGQMTTYGARGEVLKGNFQMNAISFTDTSARDNARAELEAKCDGGRGSLSACVELEQKK
jgi:hypothetical protein